LASGFELELDSKFCFGIFFKRFGGFPTGVVGLGSGVLLPLKWKFLKLKILRAASFAEGEGEVGLAGELSALVGVLLSSTVVEGDLSESTRDLEPGRRREPSDRRGIRDLLVTGEEVGEGFFISDEGAEAATGLRLELGAGTGTGIAILGESVVGIGGIASCKPVESSLHALLGLGGAETLSGSYSHSESESESSSPLKGRGDSQRPTTRVASPSPSSSNSICISLSFMLPDRLSAGDSGVRAPPSASHPHLAHPLSKTTSRLYHSHLSSPKVSISLFSLITLGRFKGTRCKILSNS
jgi:hypothetical protein